MKKQTLKERLVEIQPNVKKDEKGLIVGCPIHYPELHSLFFDCSIGCEKCWEREYQEPDGKYHRASR